MLYDFIAFSISLLLVLIYYLYLGRQARKDPDASAHLFHARIREQWIGMVMQANRNMEILAIQTLRNSVMAANFMASTAILLMVGSLNLSEKSGFWTHPRYPVSMSQELLSTLWQIKLGFLLLDFFGAFFCFAMAIRLFNHVGYMINLSNEGLNDHPLYPRTCAYLNKAGRYYMLGTRSFFFSLPIVLWFFGPYFLIPATIVLICGLILLDQVPH